MKKIEQTLVNQLTEKAKQVERKRTNFNFHETASDTLHRMLNAIEPYSYVCPHKHENPNKREAFIILSGRLLVIEFDLEGNIIDHILLDTDKGSFGVEIPPATYHTIIALTSNTVVYEVKDGPYEVSNDKGFAPWAPMEGEPNAKDYLLELLESLNLSIQ